MYQMYRTPNDKLTSVVGGLISSPLRILRPCSCRPLQKNRGLIPYNVGHSRYVNNKNHKVTFVKFLSR